MSEDRPDSELRRALAATSDTERPDALLGTRDNTAPTLASSGM